MNTISATLPQEGDTDTTHTELPSVWDTIIIGGGPAGLTAALYAARGGLRTLVLEGIPESSTVLPGGQLNLTPEIENYPGYEHGMGMELVQVMRGQAESFGAEILTLKAEAIDTDGPVKRVLASEMPGLEESQTFHSRTIVLATGAIAKRLGVPGEDDLFGRGVSTCATCDGAFFEGEDVVVVGGGDTAVEEALYLANLASSVRLVHRRDSLRANGKDVERLLSCENVNILWDTVVERVIVSDEGTFGGLDVRNVKTGDIHKEEAAGLFVAIGHDPATELLVNAEGAYALDLDEAGFIIAQEGSSLTTVPGLFVAGDVADSKYRQAITAAASGCKAAMDIAEYLGK